jgi:hypothetical protein
MLQIRPGDLVAVKTDDGYVTFAILTKQILFGGQWSFVFHGGRKTPPAPGADLGAAGFNAAVDFILAKREDRIVRVSRGNDFSTLRGPELLQQAPLKGKSNYRIWQWMTNQRVEADFVRVTDSPSIEERTAPHFSCMGADSACKLAMRGWTPDLPVWGDA